jgi:hypothetical protein
MFRCNCVLDEFRIEPCAVHEKQIKQAIADEREACAKIASAAGGAAGLGIAVAIRERATSEQANEVSLAARCIVEREDRLHAVQQAVRACGKCEFFILSTQRGEREMGDGHCRAAPALLVTSDTFWCGQYRPLTTQG